MERKLDELRQRRDWRWSALAGALAMAYACVRFQHVQRSWPIMRSSSTVTFVAARGKVHQDGVRGAFCWHCPRFGPLGAPVGEALWELWLQFRPTVEHRVGLIVEADAGVLLGMQPFVEVCRDILHAVVADRADADMFTSYSLRRFAPTLCDVRGAPWHERLAMGGWREQVADQQQRQQQRNLMPARYSGQREQLEAEVKLLH
eukprot:1318206-Amphidinium_carterae.1